MIKYTKILLVSLLFISSHTIAQNPEHWSKRLVFGGNLGLQFGTVTAIDLSPQIGYKVTDRLTPGIGISYQFYSDNRRVGYEFKTHIYGGKTFVSYLLLENVLAHVEYEALSLESVYFKTNYVPTDPDRYWSHNLFVGGGYSHPIGAKGSIFLLVLYNLNEDINSPYTNPVVRIGFNF